MVFKPIFNYEILKLIIFLYMPKYKSNIFIKVNHQQQRAFTFLLVFSICHQPDSYCKNNSHIFLWLPLSGRKKTTPECNP